MSKYFQNDSENIQPINNKSTFSKFLLYYNAINDKLQFFKYERWCACGILTLLFGLRLFFTGGYFALTYCLGINILNAFIGFISPLEDPDDDIENDSFLPQK